MRSHRILARSLALLTLAAAAPAPAEGPVYRSVKLEEFEAQGFDLMGQHVEILGDYASFLPIAPTTVAHIVDPRRSLGRKALSDPALMKQLRGVDPSQLPQVDLDLTRTPEATFRWFLQNRCREHCEGVYFRGVVVKHRVNQMPALQLLDASRSSLAAPAQEAAAAPGAATAQNTGAATAQNTGAVTARGSEGAKSQAAGAANAGSPNAASGASAGAALLFAKGAGGLSPAEQQEVFTLLGLTVSPNGKELLEAACQMPVGYEVFFEDLDRDGAPEVFVIYGNSCMSGGTGSSIVLARKGPGGHFRSDLGFPAAGYKLLDTQSQGFPDLQVGGMGFCEGVWRWDGTSYQHLRNQPTAKDGCLHVDGTPGGP